MQGPQFRTIGKSRINIYNSYLLKFYLIYLNLKNFVYSEKDLTKASTNCVVIAFFVNELSQVSSFKQKAVIIFQFLRPAALSSFIILWALFSVEKLQRYIRCSVLGRCLG